MTADLQALWQLHRPQNEDLKPNLLDLTWRQETRILKMHQGIHGL